MALLLQLTLTEKLHTIKTTTKSKMNQCRGKHYQIKQTVYTPLWRQAVKKKGLFRNIWLHYHLATSYPACGSDSCEASFDSLCIKSKNLAFC